MLRCTSDLRKDFDCDGAIVLVVMTFVDSAVGTGAQLHVEVDSVLLDFLFLHAASDKWLTDNYRTPETLIHLQFLPHRNVIKS